MDLACLRFFNLLVTEVCLKLTWNWVYVHTQFCFEITQLNVVKLKPNLQL